MLPAHPKSAIPIAAVVRDIAGNVDRIARAEMHLAIAGLRARVEEIGEVSAQFIAAAVAAMLAAIFVLLGGMFALASVLPLWLAALVIALIPAAAAAAFLLRGRAQLVGSAPAAPAAVPDAARIESPRTA